MQMKAILLFLIVTFYFPLTGQIVFEELADLPGSFVRSVNESRTGSQSAVTPEDLYGKTVTSSSWIHRGHDVASIYDVMYSPDGDLYTKNDSTILYSQNNGETFTVIDWPNGIYPPFNYTYLYVLDDDVLFINDYSGHCFYTLNNGQSWHWVGQLILSSDPVIRKVDNFIYVADPTIFGAGIIARINVSTNQVEIVDIVRLAPQYEFLFCQIIDDGTIYMFGLEFGVPQSKDHLLRYKFGQDIESLGPFPNPTDAWSFFAVGSTLFNFSPSKAEVYNGEQFQPLNYIGLPLDNETRFKLADNDHVYAIVGNSRIFRSVGSLAFPGVISGKVHLDEDQGCVPDVGETSLAFWKITVEGENFIRSGISGPNGEFRYTVPEGEYTIKAQPPGTGWELCESEFNVLVDANHLKDTIDFLAQATATCANVSLDFSTSLLRRCFENYYTIRVRNTGPHASTGTTLVLNLDPFFEFHSATIPYQQIDATTVSFDLGTLELNADVTFRIYFKLSCNAALGVEHCLTGNIISDNACPAERTSATECQVNIGSFDPNDKRSFNASGRESDRVDKDEYISYHIRFQNTGTDTAFTVRIIDPLSTSLDLSTLEMLSASHPYTYEITDGPLLVADFKNILLPDSTTNEPASHGFLKFRVKPLASFDYGTTIPNKADIYFDFNDAVLTNEVVTAILPTVGVYEQPELIDFTVFPNPAKNKLELQIDKSHRDLIDTWVIYDSQGKTALKKSFQQEESLNITSLTPGAYTLVLIGKKKVIGSKAFVKE